MLRMSGSCWWTGIHYSLPWNIETRKLAIVLNVFKVFLNKAFSRGACDSAQTGSRWVWKGTWPSSPHCVTIVSNPTTHSLVSGSAVPSSSCSLSTHRCLSMCYLNQELKIEKGLQPLSDSLRLQDASRQDIKVSLERMPTWLSTKETENWISWQRSWDIISWHFYVSPFDWKCHLRFQVMSLRRTFGGRFYATKDGVILGLPLYAQFLEWQPWYRHALPAYQYYLSAYLNTLWYPNAASSSIMERHLPAWLCNRSKPFYSNMALNGAKWCK